MSLPPTRRQLDAAGAAAERERVAHLAEKRDASRAAAAAAAAEAERERACAAERRRLLALADAVRARDGSSAAAWATLAPLLRARARETHVVTARNAAELLRELAPLAPLAPVPRTLVTPEAHVPRTAELPPVDPSRPLRVVSLFDGYGGCLIALLCALVGASLRVELVHASDKDRGKVELARATAAESGVTHAPCTPCEADITDAAVFTSAFCAAWGLVDLLFAGFPCIFHSPEGRTKAARSLRTPACKALVDGFFRVLEAATARVVIIECSPFLAKDPYFQSDFMDRLDALFWAAHIVLDASRWLPMNRERIFIVCFRDYAAYQAFDGVVAPPSRALRVEDALLAVGDPHLPLGVYDAAKAAKTAARAAVAARGARGATPPVRAKLQLSKAARAVAALPLLAGKGRSAIGVFKRHKFRALATSRALKAKGAAPLVAFQARSSSRARPRKAIKRGVVPTLIKSSSGVLRLRDARGGRALCALECGALLGVPPRFIEAMLRVASDATVVSALGDGFAVPIVRDLLMKVLRVCGWGI